MKKILLLAGLAPGLSSIGWGQSGVPYYTITTVAGVYPIGDGGPAASALLFDPTGVAIDGTGNLYIADTGNHRIRKVTAAGVISTLVGGAVGDGGDGRPASAALLNAPRGVALDSAGTLYIAATSNHRVRRVTADGVIRGIAGNGTAAFGGDGGPSTLARLNTPTSVAIDSAGNLYIADTGNHRIRKVTPDGQISTVVGTGNAGFNGEGAPGPSTQLNSPTDVAVDSAGNLFIADANNHRVRKLTLGGNVSTVAGTGTAGFSGDGGPASLAQLNTPQGLVFDRAGNLYVSGNFRIRKITPSGVISTLAGTGSAGFSGDGGPATTAALDTPRGMAFDAAGNLYFADQLNQRIRKVDPAGVITTVAGASHDQGDGGPATSAVLFSPSSVALDTNGNLYVADEDNHKVRKITAAGLLSTAAGTGLKGYNGDGRAATSAQLNTPGGVAVDGAGNLYIADSLNLRIRKVTGGAITTVAGNGTRGATGDGGIATVAQVSSPRGLAVDGSGNLYIADTSNSLIRKVSAAVMSRVAGDGTNGYSGDGGPAANAKLFNPFGVGVDSAGNLYISDTANNRVRKITPSGTISTVAGTGNRSYSGDSGPATAAGLRPVGTALDVAGNLYIVGPDSRRVRVVTPAGVIYTIAGTGRLGFSGDGGLSILADLYDPYGVAVDSAGNVYFSDRSNHRIRKLTPLAPTALTIVGGNDQSGPVGRVLLNSLAVKVAGTGGIGVPGVTVAFAVASGTARLSTTSAATGVDGTASVDVTFGSTPGTILITATVSGLPAVRFTATARDAPAGPPSPRISTGGVVGGGLSSPSIKPISANGIISIFGENFAPAGTARLVGSGDLVNGRLPTRLADVCVQVGSQLAAMFHVFPGQLNVQAPALPAEGTVPVQVVLNCGGPNENKSNLQTVTVQAATPEFFYFARNSNGTNPIAATNAVSGSPIGAPDLIPGAGSAPAKPGDILTIYATGFGETSPSFAAGELPDKIGATVAPVTVNIGGIDLAAEEVLYAGVAPFLAGVYQVNLRVPAEAPDGDLPVRIQVGDFSTPQGGFVTVKR